METRRWLLPFTHGVNMQAIECAVSLARSGGAALVAVSLVSVPVVPRSQGARLEHIQQSKDFLEAVRCEASRYKVPTERYEVFTSNVQQSLSLLAHDQRCDGIVLVTTEKKDDLLEANEVKHLLAAPPAPLLLIRLPMSTQRIWTQPLITRFLSWLRRLRWQQDDLSQELHTPGV